MQLAKPQRLKPGDRVAIVSPSSGAAETFPHVLQLGLDNLKSVFGLEPVVYDTVRMTDDELYKNPRTRAEDINKAFADPSIAAIFSSIGGDDSVRILPYLDVPTIVSNPKVFLGFSDTTTMTTWLNQNGLVTFNGPSVMAGFAQLRHLPAAFKEQLERLLFDSEAAQYLPYAAWSDHYEDWRTPGYDGETAELRSSAGWRWLQGSGRVEGPLFGGCIEVLEFLKGTRFWPEPNFWDGKILFLETSEDKPTVSQVKYMFRNYASMGILDRISAVLFGRARAYSDEEKDLLCETIRKVAAVEFGRADLPIVAEMDFGHTDPQWVMPLGVKAELDSDRETFRLLEPAVL